MLRLLKAAEAFDMALTHQIMMGKEGTWFVRFCRMKLNEIGALIKLSTEDISGVIDNED